MNWIRENTFWSSIIGILVVLVGITAYVYSSTPLQKEQEKVDTAINDLNSQVQQSKQAPDLEAEIPPDALINRLREREQMHRKDIAELAERLLELGQGIEQWFTQNRDPEEGRFESAYQDRRNELTNLIDQELGAVDQEEDSGFLDGGDNQDEEQVDWPDNPTEDMPDTQKKFWIIKRLVQDIIFAGADSFQNLSFASDRQDPITVLDDEALLQRYDVSCEVILPQEQIGRFLSRLLQVNAGGEDTPDLMMHVRNYRIVKRQTTPQILSDLVGTGENIRFSYPMEIAGDLDSWQPSKEDLPEDLRRPASVKLEIGVTVYDPVESAVASLLKEAGYENEDLKEVFPEFYTDQDVNGFVNGNNG